MQNKDETVPEVENRKDMKKLLKELLAEEGQTNVTGRIVEGSRKKRKDRRNDDNV